MIYRALSDLGLGSKIIKSGELFASGRLKPAAIEILTEQDKIAPANLPPIAALPRLKSKRLALEKIEVITVGDFLEMDNGALAKALKSTEAEVSQQKSEMYAQFSSPKPRR